MILTWIGLMFWFFMFSKEVHSTPAAIIHICFIFRQLIRDIVKALQPGRNEEMKHQRLRRRVYTVKGPNHMWHADGYDKLKPYGLCIHACIDGFSRRLIWLEVSRSNKNPALICNYFLSSVQDLSMVPRVVRLDHGTENVHVITCQRMLREVHEDSLVQVSVMLGSSNHNQRIERFWSYLRTSLIQDYMNIFKDYLSTGVIDFSKPTHVECVAFCFLPVLRSELKALFNTWNTSHEIRQMKNSGCPSGVPQTLFEHPQIHNAEEQGLLAEDEILRRCQEHYSVHNVVDVDPAFEAWALQVMIESNLALPHDIDQACKLFTKLICKIYESE